MNENLDFLQSQFDFIGDDPLKKEAESTYQLLKLAEHNYTLWCSGRQFCEGMLVDIKVRVSIDQILQVLFVFLQRLYQALIFNSILAFVQSQKACTDYCSISSFTLKSRAHWKVLFVKYNSTSPEHWVRKCMNKKSSGL